jgi:hypothetical protein
MITIFTDSASSINITSSTVRILFTTGLTSMRRGQIVILAASIASTIKTTTGAISSSRTINTRPTNVGVAIFTGSAGSIRVIGTKQAVRNSRAGSAGRSSKIVVGDGAKEAAAIITTSTAILATGNTLIIF